MTERDRSYYHRNKDARREKIEEARLQYRYGITPAEKAEIIAAQDGRCAICGDEKKLVIDHNHETGQVRGMLCLRCNFRLGLVEKPGLVERAESYLAQAAVG